MLSLFAIKSIIGLVIIIIGSASFGYYWYKKGRNSLENENLKDALQDAKKSNEIDIQSRINNIDNIRKRLREQNNIK